MGALHHVHVVKCELQGSDHYAVKCVVHRNTGFIACIHLLHISFFYILKFFKKGQIDCFLCVSYICLFDAFVCLLRLFALGKLS